MDSVLQDFKFAARQLLKDKSFFATAALTLALCIGANATIFSVVYSVLLRPLRFEEPERLVTMGNLYPGAGVQIRGSNGVPDFYDRRALTDVFEEVASYRQEGRSVEVNGVAQRLSSRSVTPSFFPLLRVSASVGRTFTEEEALPGKSDVVVLTERLWQQLYGADLTVIGSALRLDGRPFTIVGVLPPEFTFIDEGIRLYTPTSFTEEQRQQYHSNGWNMLARLGPGVSVESARSQIDALNAANLDKIPALKPLLLDAGFHTQVSPLQEDLVRDIRRNLYLLWGGVAFVLLIGCVNVANLVLVRATVRARELATRFALGASYRRVVQQVVTETVLLTFTGGALGLLFGYAAVRALGWIGISQMPRGGDIRLDGMSVAFTLGLVLAVGLFVSVMPVASLLRVRLTSVFNEEGRGGTSGRRTGLLRKAMVVAQIALALVLLMGAGLLVSSFQKILAIDPGFDVPGILTGSVVLTESRYREDADRRTFIDNVLGSIQALPEVESAGITSHIPFGEGFNDSVIFAEGYVMQPGESAISPTQSQVSPGYFETIGIRLLEGRDFDERDSASSRDVIIVDETLARRFWPDGPSALGKRMWLPDDADDLMNPETAQYFDIVGIVEPIQMRGLTSERSEVGAYYFPLDQTERRGLDLVVKTSGDPAALVIPVRRMVAELDPELPFFDIYSMQERIDRSVTDQRTSMLLTVIFGLAALSLAAVGIYGMLAYVVELRTREIGIRVALGSDAPGIFSLLFRDGFIIVVSGIGLGLIGALGLRQFIENQLFEVSAFDPSVVAVVVGLLASVAFVACGLPAWRATRIEPVRALMRG